MKAVAEGFSRFWLGRFAVSLPQECQLQSHAYKINQVYVEEFRWPRAENAYTVLWQNRLGEIGDADSGNGNIVEQGELRPGVQAVVYHPLANGELLRGETLRRHGDNGVWYKLELAASDTSPKAIKERLATISDAYTPLNEPVTPAGDWFYTRHGAVQLPYHGWEHVSLCWRGHALGLRVKALVLTAQETTANELVARFNAFTNDPAFAAMRSQIQKLRAGERKVAGLAGEEVAFVNLQQGSRLGLVCEWQYGGQRDSGKQPQFSLSLDTPAGQVEEKLALWDKILETCEPALGGE